MIEALDERAVGLRVSKAEQVRQMMKLPDAIPVTQEQALVWAESLLGDRPTKTPCRRPGPTRDKHSIAPAPLADQRSKRPSAARRACESRLGSGAIERWPIGRLRAPAPRPSARQKGRRPKPPRVVRRTRGLETCPRSQT